MLTAKNKYGTYFLPKEIEYTYTAQTISNGRVHEESTIEYLVTLNGNIVHAGAGFGDFLPALKSFDKVFAFEPNALMHESAMKTIDINGLSNIILYPFALSDQDKMGLLTHIDERGREMGPRSEISTTGTKQVRMVRLDSIISEKISVIHLDLEGHEFAALEGARGIIERDRPIIVLEIDTRAVDYNNFMLSMGYSPVKQLIYNSNEQMVFVNTVYSPLN